MNKFTDRLENDLGQIADRASPSPTAWQSIQQRMAEPDTEQETEIIMLTAEPEIDEEVAERKRNWLLAAAAVVVLAIGVGVLLSTGGDDGLVVADEPTEEQTTVTTVEPTTTDAPTTQPEGIVEAQILLPGLPLKAGPVETDLLGTTMTFEAQEGMDVIYARPGEFSVATFQEPDVVKVIVVARVGGWYTQAEAVDNTYRGEGSIDANAPEAWIADNQLIAERRPGFTRLSSGQIATIYDPAAGTGGNCLGDVAAVPNAAVGDV